MGTFLGRRRVEREVFNRLFSTQLPVELAQVSTDGRLHPRTVASAVARLEDRGQLRRDDDGRITGVSGLSVVPTQHEFVLEGVSRWTWCAYDALSILAVLGRGGRIRSTSPATGEPLTVDFIEDRPQPSNAVVFMAASKGIKSIVEDWCPHINMFEDAATARAWVEDHGRQGRIVPIHEAAMAGAKHWRPLLANERGPRRRPRRRLLPS